MRKLFSSRLLLFLALLPGMSACNYFPEDEAGVLASTTIYDATVDFSQYESFAINDSIGYLQLQLNEITGKVTPVVVYKKDPKTDIIVASVRDKLVQYCHYNTPVTSKTQDVPPDLIIDLLYMDVPGNNSAYSDWWTNYHYWSAYQWCRNYPYTPYYPVATPIPAQGTLIIDIKDLTNVVMMINLGEDVRIPVPSVWIGMVGGLQNTFRETELNDAILDCFTQTNAFIKNKKISQ
jgi:hypothetical protein